MTAKLLELFKSLEHPFVFCTALDIALQVIILGGVFRDFKVFRIIYAVPNTVSPKGAANAPVSLIQSQLNWCLREKLKESRASQTDITLYSVVVCAQKYILGTIQTHSSFNFPIFIICLSFYSDLHMQDNWEKLTK